MKNAPISEIILDQSFLKNSIEANSAIVSAIYQLGNSLNIKIIADGVENYSELHYLTKIGYKVFQGDFLGKYQERDSFIRDYKNIINKVRDLKQLI